MKDIKIKYGKSTIAINKAWFTKFKTEGEFVTAGMELGGMAGIPVDKRKDVLKETWASNQPKTEAAKPATKQEGAK